MEYKYRIGTIEDKEKLQKLGLTSYGQFKEVLTEENWNKLNSGKQTVTAQLNRMNRTEIYNGI